MNFTPKENARELVSLGGIEAIIAVLEQHPGNEDILAAATSALSMLQAHKRIECRGKKQTFRHIWSDLIVFYVFPPFLSPSLLLDRLAIVSEEAAALVANLGGIRCTVNSIKVKKKMSAKKEEEDCF